MYSGVATYSKYCANKPQGCFAIGKHTTAYDKMISVGHFIKNTLAFVVIVVGRL